jgi:hypothetical protein
VVNNCVFPQLKQGLTKKNVMAFTLIRKRPRFFLILSVTFTSCFPLNDDTGFNTFIKESENQRTPKKAILFLKESSLSADSYQVTIFDKNHKLSKAQVGNAFTVDANSINFTWLSNDSLQIDYDGKLRTFIQEKQVEGVNVVYKMP